MALKLIGAGLGRTGTLSLKAALERIGSLTAASVSAPMPSVFEEHNQAVIDAIPPSRLLVYQPGDGWEPLCRFLDVPVPDG